MTAPRRQDFARTVNRSMPKNVEVGEGINSLIAWAIGKFGGAALVAGISCYFLATVYDDMRRDRDERNLENASMNIKWLSAFQDQTKAQWYLYQAIQQLGVSMHKSPLDHISNHESGRQL